MKGISWNKKRYRPVILQHRDVLILPNEENLSCDRNHTAT